MLCSADGRLVVFRSAPRLGEEARICFGAARARLAASLVAVDEVYQLRINRLNVEMHQMLCMTHYLHLPTVYI